MIGGGSGQGMGEEKIAEAGNGQEQGGKSVEGRGRAEKGQW